MKYSYHFPKRRQKCGSTREADREEIGGEEEEEEDEHSEECLNAFSQEVEEATTLKLTVEEVEENDEHSEEWLNIFSQETERTATWEFAEEEEEEADNISFANLYEQIEALERRVIVQGMHIQQVRLEADEEVMQEHLSTSSSQPASHVSACIQG
jgi:hypothetical protein